MTNKLKNGTEQLGKSEYWGGVGVGGGVDEVAPFRNEWDAERHSRIYSIQHYWFVAR